MQWTGVDGKRVVITGATRGIGLAAAEALAALGAKVTVVGRSEARTREAATRVERARRGGSPVETAVADLASQAQVRALAAELLDRHQRIDVLVNNAGALYVRHQLSADGIELTWALNHLAPFLLTGLLLDRLRESAPARIITTSSGAHNGRSIPFDALAGEVPDGGRNFRRYGQTKLANILFTRELARRLESSGVSAYCFHPGLVATGFSRNNGPAVKAAATIARPFSRSPERGARTLVWLADTPDVGELQSGGYFVDERLATPSANARDDEAARRLWELSDAQVARSALPA